MKNHTTWWQTTTALAIQSAVLVLLTASHAPGQSWTFSTIDVPGAADYTAVWGINDQGDIVGSYYDPDAGHGFLLSNGHFTKPIDYPGGLWQVATDINNVGEIVGEWRPTPSPTTRRGFLRSPLGTFTLIRYPGSQQMRGLALNDVGTISGRYRFVDNTAAAFVAYSPYSSDDDYQSIGGAAGDDCELPPERCDLLPVDFINSTLTQAPGINNLGHVVGYYQSGSSGVRVGFRLTHEEFTLISVPGSSDTFPNRVNDQGDVVGQYWDSSGQRHGFFCRGPCQDAEDFRFPIDFPGAVRSLVTDVNEHGDIVGYYVDAGGATHGFLGRSNAAPTADAGQDQAIRAGDTVDLSGSGSFDDNTPTESLLYSWSFSSIPEGSEAVLIGANTNAPSFLADVADTYNVQLIVTDDDGLPSVPDEVMVSTDNLAPTAAAGDDQLVITGTPVFLDGSDSDDPEDDPIFSAWTITTAPDGSSATLSPPDTSATMFTPDVDGFYEVTLDVADFIGPGFPDSVEITAANPSDFAAIHIVDGGDVVEGLGSGQVTNGGNQNAFSQHLSQAVQAAQAGEVAKAIDKLEKAIGRVNGCVLREGVPDGNGPGRDWITDCQAQIAVYSLLTVARDALLPLLEE